VTKETIGLDKVENKSATDLKSEFKGTIAAGDTGFTTGGDVYTKLNEKANTSHSHAASDITSGTLAIDRIPTGTSSTTVAIGNHGHDSVYSKLGHTHTGHSGEATGTAKKVWTYTGDGKYAWTSGYVDDGDLTE